MNDDYCPSSDYTTVYPELPTFHAGQICPRSTVSGTSDATKVTVALNSRAELVLRTTCAELMIE